MTPEQYTEILNELKAIKALLTARPAAASAPVAQSAIQAPQGPPPQPHHLVDDPGSVQVHFGKNNGVALSALSDRSLEWYATEQPPRLDSSGKPYPPRPQEVTLRNAARQLWHIQHGSLVGDAAPSGTTTVMNAKPDDSEVPY